MSNQETGKNVTTTLANLIGTLSPEDKRELVKEGVKMTMDYEERLRESDRQDIDLRRRMQQLREGARTAEETGSGMEAEVRMGNPEGGDEMRIRFTKREPEDSLKEKIFGKK